jgi:hypothetical protein
MNRYDSSLIERYRDGEKREIAEEAEKAEK